MTNCIYALVAEGRDEKGLRELHQILDGDAPPVVPFGERPPDPKPGSLDAGPLFALMGAAATQTSTP